MNTADISKILTNFLNDASMRSILISGEWGIGKSFQVNKWLEELKINKKRGKRNKVFYFTVYGTEKIDDLYTEIYRKLHKIKTYLNIGFKTISLSVNAINGSFILHPFDELSSILNLVPDKKIKKSPVLIFDDIERLKGEHLDLFLGLIYKLLTQGARVVCLASLDKVKENNCFSIFNTYKEKVFDFIYFIDNIDNSIFDFIFNNFKKDEEKQALLISCNKNLRILKKGEILFNKISKRKNNKWIIDEVLVAIACVYVVRIVLECHNYQINNDDIFYVEYAKIYSEITAQNLKYFFSNEDTLKDSKIIKNLIKSILEIYYFNSFNEFKKIVEEQKEKDLLEKEFYFLSDEQKDDFVLKFSSFLNGCNVTFDEKIESKCRNIILYYRKYLDDNFYNSFIDKYLASEEESNLILSIELPISFQFLRRSDCEEDFEDIIEQRISKIKDVIKDKVLERNTKTIIKAIKEKNYLIISYFIKNFDEFTDESKKIINIESIKNILISANFCLMDLSNEITSVEWDFCFLIGSLVSKLELKEEFKNYCSKLTLGNSSYSLKARVNALIKNSLK